MLVGDNGNDVVSSFKYTLLAVILEKLFAMLFLSAWFDHKLFYIDTTSAGILQKTFTMVFLTVWFDHKV